MPNIMRYFVDSLHRRLREPDLPFLQVLMGPRQIGKTTAISQIMEQWTGSKISETADQVNPPGAKWIEFAWQRALEQPGLCLLAIDEIQKINRWSEVVKILFDRDRHKNKLRVVLSGSASLSLQQGLTESLAGRYELIRCPHWDLSESQTAYAWDLVTYLKFGGYPAPAAMIGDVPRWRSFVRDSIIEPVLGRDLQSAVTIQKPTLLRQLFALAMTYPAQEISYQKLLGQLQDEGNAATIKHYLDILQGGFLLRCLEKYSGSQIRMKTSSPKIIPLAPALIHAFTHPERIDQESEWRGRVFEAAIGAHLNRLPGDLYYWRDGNSEVDYVLVMDQHLWGIEVKSGRRRRSGGLQTFKKRYPSAKTLILDFQSGGEFLQTEMSAAEFFKKYDSTF